MIFLQMHIYKYAQSHIIFLHQHVSINPVTVIRVYYKTNILSIQIILYCTCIFTVFLLQENLMMVTG
jgi:hypothetical protein